MKLDVHSEDQAWQWLEEAVSSDRPPGVIEEVAFREWPAVSIELKGPQFNSSITPKVMGGMIDLQRRFSRAYALMAYGHADSRLLRTADRHSSELIVRVSAGSSILNIDLSEPAKAMGLKMIERMSGGQTLTAILGTSLIFGGAYVWSGWIDAEAKAHELDLNRQAEARKEEQQTERLALLAHVIESDRNLAILSEDVNEHRMTLLKSVADAESLVINGNRLTQENVSAITHAPRESSVDRRIEGVFRIQVIDVSLDETTRIRLRREDGLEFQAEISEGHLSINEMARYRQAVFERRKVNLVVFAKELRGEIVRASVNQVGALVAP